MQTEQYTGKVSRARSDKVSLAKKQLASDFSALVSDAEELLKSTASYSGESVNAARDRFKDTLDQVKGRISDAQTATNGYVRENPWRIVGAAAVVGMIVGALMHRR